MELLQIKQSDLMNAEIFKIFLEYQKIVINKLIVKLGGFINGKNS